MSKSEDDVVSDEELRMCVDVLERVWRSNSRATPVEGDFLLSKKCKGLRRVIGKFSEWNEKRKFAGAQSKEEYRSKRQAKKESRDKKLKEKAMDRKHINNRKLRLARLQKLKKLQEQVPSDLPLIPDGFVCSEDDVKCIKDEEAVEETTKLYNLRSCYVCKTRFRDLHKFYDQLCPSCADLNFQKRHATCDFKNRVAIVTGGRVKIGFNVALKLLRWGGLVYVTSRFPVDALKRYRSQKDFHVWGDRLKILGLDFRDIAGVKRFCTWFVENHDCLDALINNACQTIRRPAQYYAHLLEAESSNLLLKDKVLSAWESQSNTTTTTTKQGNAASALASSSLRSHEKSQVAVMDADKICSDIMFPANALDTNEQQIDLRRKNSWVKTIEEIQFPEVAEVFAINAIAPFTLCSNLIPLLKRTSKKRNTDTFIVNVSAMEGKFYRHKLPTHPHTNAAKAALNMMTRTSAPELAKSGVLMTAVDTGWINDENPLFKAKKQAEKHNFQTPIDEIDAAARILDPIVSRVNHGKRMFGIFLKDYMETEW